MVHISFEHLILDYCNYFKAKIYYKLLCFEMNGLKLNAYLFMLEGGSENKFLKMKCNCTSVVVVPLPEVERCDVCLVFD